MGSLTRLDDSVDRYLALSNICTKYFYPLLYHCFVETDQLVNPGFCLPSSGAYFFGRLGIYVSLEHFHVLYLLSIKRVEVLHM